MASQVFYLTTLAFSSFRKKGWWNCLVNHFWSKMLQRAGRTLLGKVQVCSTSRNCNHVGKLSGKNCQRLQNISFLLICKNFFLVLNFAPNLISLTHLKTIHNFTKIIKIEAVFTKTKMNNEWSNDFFQNSHTQIPVRFPSDKVLWKFFWYGVKLHHCLPHL